MCLALKSPPAKNFGLSVSKNNENCSLEMDCLGGQNRALTTIFDPLLDVMLIDESSFHISQVHGEELIF